MSSNLMPTSRTRIVREPDRGVYDRDAINLILDEAFLCHVGFVVDQPGHPSLRHGHTAGWTCARPFGL